MARAVARPLRGHWSAWSWASRPHRRQLELGGTRRPRIRRSRTAPRCQLSKRLAWMRRREKGRGLQERNQRELRKRSRDPSRLVASQQLDILRCLPCNRGSRRCRQKAEVLERHEAGGATQHRAPARGPPQQAGNSRQLGWAWTKSLSRSTCRNEICAATNNVFHCSPHTHCAYLQQRFALSRTGAEAHPSLSCRLPVSARHHTASRALPSFSSPTHVHV